MNCAHLENCLHEAREQAHTNRCAAERKASEFAALRISSVKMNNLFDRFRTCVNLSSGLSSFVESLRTLAHSLARYYHFSNKYLNSNIHTPLCDDCYLLNILLSIYLFWLQFFIDRRQGWYHRRIQKIHNTPR